MTKEAYQDFLQRPILRWFYAIIWTLFITTVLVQSSSEPVIGPAAPQGPPTLPREVFLTVSHLAAFSVMTFLWWWTLKTHLSHHTALMLALLIALFLGGMTEYMQSFVPSREMSLYDLTMNGLAAVAAALAVERLPRSSA